MRNAVDQKELLFMLDFINSKKENERSKEEKTVLELSHFIKSDFTITQLSPAFITTLMNDCNMIKNDEISTEHDKKVFSYLLSWFDDVKNLNRFTNETVKHDVILSLLNELDCISYDIGESILRFASNKINYFDDQQSEGDEKYES